MKVWQRFADSVYSILKHTHLENVLKKFTMTGESNRELLDTLWKLNNSKISVLVYRECLHHTSHQQTTSKERVVSSLFNRAYSIIANKDDSTKGNSRIKLVFVKREWMSGNHY